MTPTPSQSKCLRMLEEWASLNKEQNKPESCDAEAACLTLSQNLDPWGMTDLVLLGHAHGLLVSAFVTSLGKIRVLAQVSKFEAPTLAALRRRAHKNRLDKPVTPPAEQSNKD